MFDNQADLNSAFARMFINLLLDQGGPMYAVGYLESFIEAEMNRNSKFRKSVLERIATNKQRAA